MSSGYFNKTQRKDLEKNIAQIKEAKMNIDLFSFKVFANQYTKLKSKNQRTILQGNMPSCFFSETILHSPT
jgi:hypothetical protein